MSLGTIVIDEQVFPISDVLLERGKIFVRAQVEGPVPERKGSTSFACTARMGASSR